MKHTLPNFLPFPLVLEPGRRSDYLDLEQFHYIPRRPATWAAVWRIRYTDNAGARTIAVGVLSYPTVRNGPRERLLDLQGKSAIQKIAFINANVRTISRVVIHPQFRSLGLSTLLVECLIENCPTRYVEATAMMARVHPFFDRAGMTRIDPEDPKRPVYYIYDRGQRQNEWAQRAA